MLEHIRPAVVMIVAFTLLTGIAYPLAMTEVAQALMPRAANGSLIMHNGSVIGSELVGQQFAEDKYFRPRPSATSQPDPNDSSKAVDAPYNAAASTGSNLGPISQKLLDRVGGDVQKLRSEAVTGAIPVDAVTASGSGLDPHISPENALMQVARIAAARKMPVERVRALVEARTEGRTFGVFGEPRVNVLLLNLALDSLK